MELRRASGTTVLPEEPVTSLGQYRGLGGGDGIRAAQEMGAASTIDEVSRAGLRGRGGGGFPTGTKWRSVRAAGGQRRYLVANGAEGEPGTFKDRAILRYNPYQVVEGMAIAAFAIDAAEVYVAMKRRFEREVEALRQAVVEMSEAGILGDCAIGIVEGPDEYLFGEETGLLEVIQGGDPLPRVIPPYQQGLFATTPEVGWSATPKDVAEGRAPSANPTVVNNVETLAHVTHILAKGAEWFRSRGTASSPGTMVFTISGEIARPGVYELEMGTPLRVLVEEFGGGVRGGRGLKVVISGVANEVVTRAGLDTPMDFDAMAAAGSGLGSGGFVVYDDTVCAVALARVCSRFLYVESCGQCPPCKLGTGEITARLEQLEASALDRAGLGVIQERLRSVTDGRRCYLPVEEVRLIGSLLATYDADVQAHLNGRCELRHDVPVPKISDFDEGTSRFTLDERQARKRPDWTYDSEE